MLYEMSIVVLQAVALYSFFVTFNEQPAVPWRLIPLRCLSYFVALVLTSLPSYMVLQQYLNWEEGHPISVANTTVPIWASVVGAAWTLCQFASDAINLKHRKVVTRGRMIATAAGLVVGGYLSIVAVDQLYFMKPWSSNYLMVNISLLRSIGEVRDVDCNQDFILVEDKESADSRYRCPAGNSIWLRAPGSYFFLPWPEYQSGRSRDLGRALKKMLSVGS